MPKIKEREIYDFKICVQIEGEIYGNYVVIKTNEKEEYYCKNCGSGSCFGC